MKKILITTLGCKVNQADSEELARRYADEGCELVREGEPADVCVVNTCTVTAKADRQCRNMIRKLRGKYPKAQIVVTGCYANVAKEELEKMNEIDQIIYSSSEPLKGRVEKPQLEFSTLPIDYGRRSNTKKTRPMLKVQDGCDRFCTYCIVPHARGRSRSVPVKEVVKRIKELVAAGNKEIVLTGIHLGAYGKDLRPQTGLAELLLKICDRSARLRLSSIDPDELSEDLISNLKFEISNRRVCPHFHIPLQSGSDEILKKMGRRYTTAQYRAQISNLRSEISNCAIGADVIVGFPGETKELFEETKKFIDSLPVDYLHVFPYSRRELTAASKLKETVPNTEKHRRVKVLMDISKKRRLSFYKSFIGKDLHIVIEYKRDKMTGLLKGVSENYIPVLVAGGDELMGELVKVKVTEVNNRSEVKGTKVIN